jgi:hypothetical protein
MFSSTLVIPTRLAIRAASLRSRIALAIFSASELRTCAFSTELSSACCNLHMTHCVSEAVGVPHVLQLVIGNLIAFHIRIEV